MSRHVTAIGWTDEVWNPVTGCDRVSPGCAHCYALTLAPRLRAMGNAKYVGARDGDPRTSGPAFGVTLHPDTLDQPLRWRRPRRVFVNSMSDLFHEEIPDEYIDHVFAVIALAERHTFQILTKRPERMRDYLRDGDVEDRVSNVAWHLSGAARVGISSEMQVALGRGRLPHHWPSRNAWLGVSIENRRFVHRADVLRETPAAVRFISAEPLLGPLIPRIEQHYRPGRDGFSGRTETWYRWPDGYSGGSGLHLQGISWLIVGGESGPNHRPMRVDWARDLHDAARDVGTAFFMKQDSGSRSPASGAASRDDLWVHEFPRPKVAA